MPGLLLILILSFIESFSTILFERGSYFFTNERLGFTDNMNLCLALAFGVAYVAGALLSHPVTQRVGERRLLITAVSLQLLTNAVMAAWPSTATIYIGGTLSGLLCGQKWPVVESYVTAGHTPRKTVRILGLFNISWALAVPLALVASGPLIVLRSWSLFALAATCNLAALGLVCFLPARPLHLPHDHPERPSSDLLKRLIGLMRSGRFLMLAAYSCMWILAALLPGIFESLGQKTAEATGLSAVLDVARLAMFAAMFAWAGWHGRTYPLAVAMPILGGGFCLAASGLSVPLVVVGEVLFGMGVGIIYFSALYYAIVVENASVAAGGGHEGLIGSGFALGPLAGLVGVWIGRHVGSAAAGRILGAAPILCICFLFAGLCLLRLRAHGPAGEALAGDDA